MSTVGICARPENADKVWMWILPDADATPEEQQRIRAGNAKAKSLCLPCPLLTACRQNAQEHKAEGVVQGAEEYPLSEIPICSECPNEVSGLDRLTCSSACARDRQIRMKRERDRRRRRDILPAVA